MEYINRCHFPNIFNKQPYRLLSIKKYKLYIQIPQFKRKEKTTHIGAFIGSYQAQAFYKNKKAN